MQLTDPSGIPVTVSYGVPELPALPERAPLPLNFGTSAARVNATQRPERLPAEIERLGHVVLGTTRFRAALDWYLDTLGLIVSDFLHLDGQRERGPVMAFIRCDQGSVPTDHHTLAMLLAPQTGYVHSAYQVTDLDEVAASGQYLRDRGYRHSWGIGRHIQGSQIFDYWRDPDKLMFEHYADGDVFDCAEAGRVGAAVGQRPGAVGAACHSRVHRRPRPRHCPRRNPGAARKGQRHRSRVPAGPGQGDELMTARLARTADGWWLLTPAGLVRLGLDASTTGALLADGDRLAAAVEAAGTTAAADPRLAVPAGSLDLLSPVTAPARIVAQAVNYRSHAVESGFDPDKIPPVFFRKSSHSLTGPAGDILRPDGVGFLDYEVELGLVIGADLPVGTIPYAGDPA